MHPSSRLKKKNSLDPHDNIIGIVSTSLERRVIVLEKADTDLDKLLWNAQLGRGTPPSLLEMMR